MAIEPLNPIMLLIITFCLTILITMNSPMFLQELLPRALTLHLSCWFFLMPSVWCLLLFPLLLQLRRTAALPSIKELFKLFMQTYTKKVRNQVLHSALVRVGEKALNRPLKAKNLKLYFRDLPIEYHYLCR